MALVRSRSDDRGTVVEVALCRCGHAERMHERDAAAEHERAGGWRRMTSLHVATDDDVRLAEEDAERAFTSSEVLALTGVTYRMLDYWCRAGLLREQARIGSGHARRFSAYEVDLVHAVVALIGVGFTLTTAFAIAPRLVQDEVFGRRFADLYDLTIVIRRPEPPTAEATT